MDSPITCLLENPQLLSELTYSYKFGSAGYKECVWSDGKYSPTYVCIDSFKSAESLTFQQLFSSYFMEKLADEWFSWNETTCVKERFTPPQWTQFLSEQAVPVFMNGLHRSMCWSKSVMFEPVEHDKFLMKIHEDFLYVKKENVPTDTILNELIPDFDKMKFFNVGKSEPNYPEHWDRYIGYSDNSIFVYQMGIEF